MVPRLTRAGAGERAAFIALLHHTPATAGAEGRTLPSLRLVASGGEGLASRRLRLGVSCAAAGEVLRVAARPPPDQHAGCASLENHY